MATVVGWIFTLVVCHPLCMPTPDYTPEHGTCDRPLACHESIDVGSGDTYYLEMVR